MMTPEYNPRKLSQEELQLEAEKAAAYELPSKKRPLQKFVLTPKKSRTQLKREAMLAKQAATIPASFDYTGSNFDSFLREEGILEEVESVAIDRVATWDGQR